MDDHISFFSPERLCSIGITHIAYLIPVHKAVDVLTCVYYSFSIGSAEKDNFNPRELIFKHARHRKGKDHIPNAVGTANDNTLKFPHKASLGFLFLSNLPDLGVFHECGLG